MISQFGFVLLFFISAMLFVLLMLGISRYMRPNRPSIEKNKAYESGEEALGSAQVSFSLQFYIVALIFLLFDVELAVLFPWATVFGDKTLIAESHGWWAVYTGIEMFIFIFILSLGLVYAWGQGHLDWIKPEQKAAEYKSLVPKDLYDDINTKYAKS